VRDELANQKRRWSKSLVHHVRVAQRRGEIRADVDPEQLAFELDAAGVLANSLWQLNGDNQAFKHARAAVRGRLEAAATDAGRQALAART
jgi:Tetracyclin repressor-like, C-terminal domain